MGGQGERTGGQQRVAAGCHRCKSIPCLPLPLSQNSSGQRHLQCHALHPLLRQGQLHPAGVCVTTEGHSIAFLDNLCQCLTAHAAKKVVSCVQRESDVFQPVPIASRPACGHSRGAQGFPRMPAHLLYV